MLTQVFLADFEPVVTRFGPSEMSKCLSLWLKMRASSYEAQIGLGERLVTANPRPPMRFVSAKLPAPPPAPR